MGNIIPEGLIISPLKIIPTEKGSVRHGLKQSDTGYSGFGEAYFSEVAKNEIKGWKKHTRMNMNLVIVSGAIRFVIYDDRENSQTQNSFFEITLSLDNYHRLTVPAGLWMAFQGIADSNLLMNLANIEHDPKEVHQTPISTISYNW